MREVCKFAGFVAVVVLAVKGIYEYGRKHAEEDMIRAIDMAKLGYDTAKENSDEKSE